MLRKCSPGLLREACLRKSAMRKVLRTMPGVRVLFYLVVAQVPPRSTAWLRGRALRRGRTRAYVGGGARSCLCYEVRLSALARRWE